MICGVCGNKIMPGEEICSRCGSKVTKQEQEVKSSFQELNVEENQGPVVVAPEEVAKVDNATPPPEPLAPGDVVKDKKAKKEKKAKQEKPEKTPKEPKIPKPTKSKEAKPSNNKKYIIVTVLILLGLIIIGATNYLDYIDKKADEKQATEKEEVKEEEQEKLLQQNFKGYQITYPSSYIPQEKDDVLYLTNQGKKIEYTITIHDNSSMDMFIQSKDAIKNTLTQTGYTIVQEDFLVRDSITYYVYDMTAVIGSMTYQYQYYITEKDGALIEVLLYCEEADNTYDANLGLTTIINGTSKLS